MAVPPPTRILRSAVGTVLTLLFGATLVLIGVILVTWIAPGGARDLHAYEAAPRCPAAPAAPAECRWTQEFTVSGVRLTRSRSESDRAFLTGADGVRRETFYDSRGPVLDALDEGDRVTGTIWRGFVTEIAAEGDSQKTQDAPADMRARGLIGALLTVPCGLLMTAACAWRLLRRRAVPDPTPGMVAALGLAFALFAGGLISPVLLGKNGENLWMVAAVWLPIAILMAAAARLYVTRKRAPETVTI
ncbi:hypothetical protein GCM10027176_60790 [Actinoallomurus bryophytorum]|uniref:Uncharacterized protein n=1 Tax=Actinoallomurus bryophytorum TaxID=1490222 RepID=A0A543CP49_9ACTN|nr:hypothetical protein [Actinoallomurus bryophytorum]TQL98875.1 hypothetical protein FB559_4510 [Actinoallomurus bryophytorum]